MEIFFPLCGRVQKGKIVILGTRPKITKILINNNIMIVKGYNNSNKRRLRLKNNYNFFPTRFLLLGRNEVIYDKND